MGNYHAQFLGGLGAAMPPGYPVMASSFDREAMMNYLDTENCLLKF
jgi:hypothetical protein